MINTSLGLGGGQTSPPCRTQCTRRGACANLAIRVWCKAGMTARGVTGIRRRPMVARVCRGALAGGSPAGNAGWSVDMSRCGRRQWCIRLRQPTLACVVCALSSGRIALPLYSFDTLRVQFWGLCRSSPGSPHVMGWTTVARPARTLGSLRYHALAQLKES